MVDSSISLFHHTITPQQGRLIRLATRLKQHIQCPTPKMNRAFDLLRLPHRRLQPLHHMLIHSHGCLLPGLPRKPVDQLPAKALEHGTPPRRIAR